MDNFARENLDFKIENLGECRYSNPLKKSYIPSYKIFTSEREKVRYSVYYDEDKGDPFDEIFLEKAGPREKIYFTQKHVRSAIVTCGGLCPGLNDVIRALVRTLWYSYGVKIIYGVRYGYQGFLNNYKVNFIDLNPNFVDDIHKMGGTILGSSRGGGNPVEIVDTLERMNINILFTIGGDGTQRGAIAIADEAKKRNLKLAVIGIPKTIDNDLLFVQRSFGFETAVDEAVIAVQRAHTEAESSYNGIGVVKVMGRDSGFIAAHTALASNDVNFCLIPESNFDLEGNNGFLAHLERRLLNKEEQGESPHAVILVAEGAGQKFFNNRKAILKDASGNILHEDIGIYIKGQIARYFKEKNIEINLKYIDPSYIIRSVSANPSDSLYCARLGANAVHAAMAGKTKLLISLWSNKFVHVPIKMAVMERNYVKISGSFWRDVLFATGQPFNMENSKD